MASPESTSEHPADDTAAFRAYYNAEERATDERRGLLYRLLVGWWRERA